MSYFEGMVTFYRAFLVWVLIAFLEVIHGIIRAKFLAPKVGDLRSRQIGVFSGSLIFFVVTLASFDWMNISTPDQALGIGLLWLISMLALEFLVGHFIFRFSWKWLLNDFNIFKGRLLALGMIFLALSPLLVWKIRQIQ